MLTMIGLQIHIESLLCLSKKPSMMNVKIFNLLIKQKWMSLRNATVYSPTTTKEPDSDWEHEKLFNFELEGLTISSKEK